MDDEERMVADRLDGVPLPEETMDLVGHAAALVRLQDAHRQNRLHQAWMISGPEGIGKATFALHFARQLLTYPDGRSMPDPVAPSAIPEGVSGPIARGAHPNLLHLRRPWDAKKKDFKTRLTVDEVRRTQAFYAMTAGAGGWRIAIVDCADDMNPNAANALLKILEEPPRNSLFLVLSHSPGKLLPTIRSRCQHLPLKPLAASDIVDVIKPMGMTVDNRRLADVASRAEGSVRRALELVTTDALDHLRVFEALLLKRAHGSPQDWTAVHALAGQLATKAQEEAYHLFFDLALNSLASHVRELAIGTERASAGFLAGQAEVWEKTVESKRVADAYNLDKKQEVLNFFGRMFALARP
ncbi:MAG: DNA polymerase III subunit delta' [Pseudomonadota bacterium]